MSAAATTTGMASQMRPRPVRWPWLVLVFFVVVAGTALGLVVYLGESVAEQVPFVIAFSLLAALSSIGFAWFAEGFWSALAFRALGGLALGGTYMPGLKALTDRVQGPSKTRYQSFYTASFSVGSSVSLFLTGVLAAR